MGVLDKVKFWKRDEEPLDLDAGLPPLGEGVGHHDPMASQDGMPQMSMEPKFDNPKDTFNEPRSFQQQSVQNNQGGNDIQKDLHLISAKLDTIKSELDSINQRVSKIEKIAEGEKGGQFISKDPWAKY